MNITMDINQARFTLADVIKLCAGLITLVAFSLTIQSNLSSLTSKVNDIRDTQIENTKKNDQRWETISLQINQLKIDQSLMEQRIQAIEQRSK